MHTAPVALIARIGDRLYLVAAACGDADPVPAAHRTVKTSNHAELPGALRYANGDCGIRYPNGSPARRAAGERRWPRTGGAARVSSFARRWRTVRTMAKFENGDVTLHYETWGSGPAVLLLAPGGLRASRIETWSVAPWNPIEALNDRYRVVAMDQRNTGTSFAPITGSDGWSSYAGDQLALMDHLGIERFCVMGMCIGGAFVLELAREASDRVVAGGGDATDRAGRQPRRVPDDLRGLAGHGRRRPPGGLRGGLGRVLGQPLRR